MKVIYENELSDEKLQMYDDMGIEPVRKLLPNDIERGELVIFYLSTLLYRNIDLIGYLLATNHNVILKYLGKVHKLTHIDEWRRTVQDPKDQLKTISIKHPILEAYYEKRREYNLRMKDIKAKEKYDVVITEELPDDLDMYLQAFAPRYNVEYDDNTVSKYLAYQSIKFYIDNNIEYSNPAPVIDIDETPLFGLKFNFDSKISEPEIESFGDEKYMEDYINKSLMI